MRTLAVVRDPRALLRATLMLAAVAALIVLVAPPVVAQFGGFTWTLAGSELGSGSQSPTGLHVVGPDVGGCAGGSTTQFETVIPGPGTLSVDVDFTNLDSGVAQGHALYDAPCVLVDGGIIKPPSAPCCPNGWPTGSYHFDLPVSGGQVIGLGVWASDCMEGPGIADFSDLVFTPSAVLTYAVGIDVHERFQVHGGGAFVNYGLDAASLGDIDADGRGDLVVLAPGPDPGPLGQILFLSGNDGSTLISLIGDFSKARAVAGAGDFNDDGTLDAVIGLPGKLVNGKPNAGRAEVRSGADGALLYTVDGGIEQGFLGAAVAGAGDMDGNGADDVIIAQTFSPGVQGKGTVSVRNGPTGSLIWQVQATQDGLRFGQAVAGGGDANGDGASDVLVGEPGGPFAGPSFIGVVHVYSGATGGQLFQVSGPGYFGGAVSWAGDVNGDGHDDLLVGAATTTVGGVATGRVALFSGLDGGLLLERFGSASQPYLGFAVAGGKDLTGDGHLDFAVVSGAVTTQNDVIVYDAVTGAVENVLPYNDATFGGISGFDLLSDVNGDGLADLMASSQTSGPNGTVMAFQNLDRGPPPQLTVSNAPVPGFPLTIAVDGLLPAKAFYLVVGAALQQLPFKGGVLIPSPNLLLPLMADGQGHKALPVTWPTSLPQWTTIWMQAWAADADAKLGWISSDGLGVTQTVP